MADDLMTAQERCRYIRGSFGGMLSVAVVLAAVLTGCFGLPEEAEPTPLPEPTPTVSPSGSPDVAAPAEPPECLLDEFGCAVIPPGETIKIGMAGPMSGPYASFGVDISRAGEMAVEDFGEYLDWQFELVVGDTQGDPANAPDLAREWASDPTLVAVAGHIFSGETMAALPIYEEAGLPMLSPSATNPDLTRQGSRVFNRVAFTDVVQARSAAEYLYATLGIQRLAVMHDGEPYGQALAELTADNFESAGGRVVARETITPGREDYSEVLAGVAGRNPQALYYGGYDAEAAVLINQMSEAGLEDVIFFGCDGTFGEALLEATGESGEGVYSTTLIPPVTEARRAFDEAFEERWGVAPGADSPFTWNGYDAVGALIAAVKRVALLGGDGNLYVPRGALVEAVRSLSGYPGLSGEITCDRVGECSTSGPTFYVIRGGEWVPAP